jgi:hypothetical protein
MIWIEEASMKTRTLLDGPQASAVGYKPVAFKDRPLPVPSSPLTQFFQQSPLAGVELDIRRHSDLAREV